MNDSRVLRLPVVVVSVLALVVAGCGDDDGGGEGGGEGAVEPVSDEGGIVSDAPLEETELTIPNIAESGLLLARMVAVQEGLFEKHGLDVDVVEAPSAQGVDLFITGEFVFGPAGGASTVAPIVATGTPIEVYAVTGDQSNYSFWVQPEIESLDDLEGGVVGISSFGGLAERITRAILEQQDFDVDSVTLQPLGNVSAIVQAMAAGEVDAGAFGSPFGQIARDEGMNQLYTAQELAIPAVQAPIVGDPQWVEDNPNSARAFLRAWLEGLWIVLTDPETAQQALADAAEIDPDDTDLLAESYDEATAAFRHPASVAEDIETLVPLLYDGFDEPERITDPDVVLPSVDLVQDLHDEGFFEALEEAYGPIDL